MRPLARLRGIVPRILSACPAQHARQIVIASTVLELLLMVYTPRRWLWAVGLFMLLTRPLLLDALLAAQRRAMRRTIILAQATVLRAGESDPPM